jgi:hypothetical protein
MLPPGPLNAPARWQQRLFAVSDWQCAGASCPGPFSPPARTHGRTTPARFATLAAVNDLPGRLASTGPFRAPVASHSTWLPTLTTTRFVPFCRSIIGPRTSVPARRRYQPGLQPTQGGQIVLHLGSCCHFCNEAAASCHRPAGPTACYSALPAMLEFRHVDAICRTPHRG